MKLTADGDVIALLGAELMPCEVSRGWYNLVQDEPERAVRILEELSCRRLWREAVWSTVLDTFRYKPPETRRPLWRGIAQTLLNADHEFLVALADHTAKFLESAACFASDDPESFWSLWDRAALMLPRCEYETCGDPLDDALNAPSALLASAAIQAGSCGHSVDLLNRIEGLVSGDGAMSLAARTQVFGHIEFLDQCASDWVVRVLLPFSNWAAHPVDAAAFWRVIARSHSVPRLPKELKTSFQTAFQHLEDLGDQAEDFCRLFVGWCLEGFTCLTPAEINEIIRSLDPSARAAVARALNCLPPVQSESERGDRWRNRIQPFLSQCWPKDLSLRDSQSALGLTQAAIESGDAFQEAVDFIEPLLTAVEPPSWYSLTKDLNAGHHPDDQPEACLSLLGKIWDEGHYTAGELPQILDRIRVADPGLAKGPKFKKLDEFATTTPW